ncbi:MAG: hypothetical protein D6706_18645 [Chloroflexi bacterium]|nr:MAG: hypothetical protein D6706_18645 [Chloroflexota bacterium]
MKLDAWSVRLHQLASGRVTLVAVVVFLLFVGVVLPAWTGGADVPAPDLMFTYSASRLYEVADALGENGRFAYIRDRFTLDVIWPVIYTFFLVTTISWLAQHGLERTSGWQRANLLPLAAVLFDLLENVSTALVMARYPAETAVVASLAGFFTLFKWLLVGASFAVWAFVAWCALYRLLRH